MFKQGILKQDSQHKVLTQGLSENSLEQECLVHRDPYGLVDDEGLDEKMSVYENFNISASTLNVENSGSKFGFRHFILLIFALTPLICFIVVVREIDLCECDVSGKMQEDEPTEPMTTEAVSTEMKITETGITEAGMTESEITEPEITKSPKTEINPSVTNATTTTLFVSTKTVVNNSTSTKFTTLAKTTIASLNPCETVTCLEPPCQISCELELGYYSDSRDCRNFCYCSGNLKIPSKFQRCSTGLFWDPTCGSQGCCNWKLKVETKHCEIVD